MWFYLISLISLVFWCILHPVLQMGVLMIKPKQGSAECPYTGKAFKESMVSCLDGLVNLSEDFLGRDGSYRIHLKFANGRLATIEARAEDQIFDAAVEPLLVHEVKYQQLRANWTTVSAAVVFGIAFAFEYKDKNGESVRLVLYKSQVHQSDDFAQSIIAEMQVSLEYDALGEITEKMQTGFKRLEKLLSKK